PAPIYFAHRILRALAEGRRAQRLFDLQPDAKSQVTVQYVEGKPTGCTKVVVSTRHNAHTRNGKKYTPNMVRDMIADTVASALPNVAPYRLPTRSALPNPCRFWLTCTGPEWSTSVKCKSFCRRLSR